MSHMWLPVLAIVASMGLSAHAYYNTFKTKTFCDAESLIQAWQVACAHFPAKRSIDNSLFQDNSLPVTEFPLLPKSPKTYANQPIKDGLVDQWMWRLTGMRQEREKRQMSPVDNLAMHCCHNGCTMEDLFETCPLLVKLLAKKRS